ncbi:hypothetical protein QBC39DRAFT_360096 [Podospora conica]|nr:hypothetical protein QBC39DRAFT_360096 [Schizothecium conicum]
MCPTNSSISICNLDPSYLVMPSSRLYLHHKCRDAIIDAAVAMGIHPNKLDTDPFFILRTFAPLVHLDLEAYPACFRVRLKFLTAVRYCINHATKVEHNMIPKDTQPAVQASEEELDTLLGSPAPETSLPTATPALAAPSHSAQAEEPAQPGLATRVKAVQEEMESVVKQMASVAKDMDACVNSMGLLAAELEEARKELGTGSGRLEMS